MQAILVSQVFVFLKMNIIMLIYLTKPFVFSFQVQDYQKFPYYTVYLPLIFIMLEYFVLLTAR